MLTGVAVIPKLVSLGRWGFRPTPYDWVPLAVIILLILLIFFRVYVVGDRSISRSRHRSGRPTAHGSSHVPEQGEDSGHPARDHQHPAKRHGHHSEPKRRPHRQA
jgi:hypothetical protein